MAQQEHIPSAVSQIPPLRTRFIHSGAVLGRENARRSLNCRGSCARNIEGIILFSVRESRQSSLRSKRRREQLRANGLFGQIEKPRIIAQTLRTSIATLLNTVVDIPLIGEVEEQILFTKIVDVVSDLIEDWMIESMGNGANILGELERMDQAKLDVWRDKVVDDLNGKIDLPILNEDQEAPIIRFIVDKYLDSSLKGDMHILEAGKIPRNILASEERAPYPSSDTIDSSLAMSRERL